MKNKSFLFKKLGILACIISISFVLSLTGCFSDKSSNSDNPDNPDNPGDKDAVIVCLGDSLTAGLTFDDVTGYAQDKDKAYPAILQEKVTAEVINAGVSGETTAEAYNRLDEDVLSEDPDIVIVCLGGNDFFMAEDETELDESLESIRTYLKKIVEDLDTKKRHVFIVKFYNEDIARAKLSELGITVTADQDSWIAQSDAVFDEIVGLSTENLELVLIEDIWTGVYGSTTTMSDDDTHPNAAGYEIMADNYFNAMESYLEELDVIK